MVLGAAAALSAQTLDQLREAVREAASADRYSLFVASVGSLVRDSEMSGGRLEVDSEPKLRVVDATLPYREDFFRDGERSWLRVEATLEAADESESAPRLATPEMLGQRREALAALRAMGGLKDVIPDPAAWQREQREDRPLPGRE
jgi:hypothetical protein